MGRRLCVILLSSAVGCATEEGEASYVPTLAGEVAPVTRVEDALPGVFIPPYRDCRTVDGRELCVNVSIAGATQPGRSFAADASCGVVRTQRPYWPASPAARPDPADPRAQDAALRAELAWAKEQIAATGCVCCHASSAAPQGASQWDIEAGPLWLDTLSDTGLALFLGHADSSVLGAYPPSDNHGFDRGVTGVPTTDVERMRALLGAELRRRGRDEAWARALPPFGGPIYQNSVRPPVPCGADEGIDEGGRVRFRGETARYVYVLEEGSKNPGVPPNLDRPAGLLWRLDVSPSQPGVNSGILYGTTPRGTFQDTPSSGPAPTLQPGKTYQLTALVDVGLPIVNCTFQLSQAGGQAIAQALGASE